MHIIKGALLGMVAGALLGLLPGVIAGLFGANSYLGAAIGHDASSLVRYLGMLIGGGAGAIVGAMVEASDVETDADVELAQPPEKK